MKQNNFKSKVIAHFSTMGQIFDLLIKNKKWWLMPFFFVLFFISTFAILVGGGSILPAIYALF